jgi:HlyD family secretion protein
MSGSADFDKIRRPPIPGLASPPSIGMLGHFRLIHGLVPNVQEPCAKAFVYSSVSDCGVCMKKSTKIWIGAVVVLIGAGIAFGVVKSKDAKLPRITVGKVDRHDVISKVTASGKIEAQKKVDLSANIMGQIVNMAVREGDVVKKGDFLLQIDKAQLAASAAGAEASVRALLHDRDSARASSEQARITYARAQKSYADHVIPTADLDSARSLWQSAEANVSSLEGKIEQARASLAGANDTLSKTTIHSPISGIISSLPVEEGEVAVVGTMNNAGTVLMTISDMSVVEAVLDVDETDIPRVKAGQPATVTIDAYPNRTFEGVVTEVGSSPRKRQEAGLSSNSEAINFEVKIQVKTPPPDIRPGFTASADIITGTQTGATTIPMQALVVRDKKVPPGSKPAQEEGVYRFDRKAGTIHFVPVTTGLTGETEIAVSKGVSPGQEIVTGPFKALREIEDGNKVKELPAGGDHGGKGPA